MGFVVQNKMEVTVSHHDSLPLFYGQIVLEDIIGEGPGT